MMGQEGSLGLICTVWSIVNMCLNIMRYDNISRDNAVTKPDQIKQIKVSSTIG